MGGWDEIGRCGCQVGAGMGVAEAGVCKGLLCIGERVGVEGCFKGWERKLA